MERAERDKQRADARRRDFAALQAGVGGLITVKPSANGFVATLAESFFVPNQTTLHVRAKAKMDALGLEGICSRIEQGHSMTEIAESLGTDVSQLCRYLDRSEQAIQRSARAMRRSAEAWLDRGLRAVQDALDKKGNIDPSAARAYAQECARQR